MIPILIIFYIDDNLCVLDLDHRNLIIWVMYIVDDETGMWDIFMSMFENMFILYIQ